MAGIIRILEEHSSRSSFTKEPVASASENASGNGSITKKPFPFRGANLPYDTPRGNAAYVTRELVSTYLITHPHLDHLSGFVINTACFTQTECPKRLAALPSTIEAIKTHIFNDIIWPNLSDEESGVGLVTYQRLPEAALEYVEVCSGLSAQAWPVSHGHCMKSHYHRGSQTYQGKDGTTTDRSPGGSRKKMCVYDSTVYFIRDDATGKEVMMWGDVEPDSISLSPRNHPAWSHAAAKFHRGDLDTIFIECSYDCNQPDEALYGHLSPPHLMDEMRSLARMVVSLKKADDIEKRGRLKRKRMSYGYHNDDPEIMARRIENPNAPSRVLEESQQCHGPSAQDDEVNGIHGNIRWNKNRLEVDSRHSFDRFSPEISPRAVGPKGVDFYDTINLAVGQRTPEERLPQGGAGNETSDLGPAPLKGLHLVITHVKDTLLDDVNVPEDILRSIQGLEAVQQLGVTFSLSEQGRSLYF
ncbi:cAMP phosphodiesterases class-II-domain-containing protein [Tuber borchii]|uniref:cAMP phosphodiesterases class-II-domain-containing protein n=1 Tax=Tuber borchii TaxID=42251 RepID=A0A2T7A7G4_TUBBO|nr:cAMP phosphodiesterases class-II-domain-containing protein [Tuber borchii]